MPSVPHKPWLNVVPYLTVAILICAFYSPLFLPTNSAFGYDYYDFNVPMRVYASSALRAGRLPLWAPEIYGGYPFLADPQIGTLGPLNLLVAALVANPADSYFFQLYLVLHVVLSGAAGVFLARSVGISRAGATVCGLICALNGHNVWHFTHVNFFPAIAAGLFAIGCMVRAVHRRDFRWSALGGLAIASALLSSHPQSAIYMGYAVTLAAAFLFVRYGWRHEVYRTAALCGLPLVIGFAGALAQILPSLGFFHESSRAWMPFREASKGALPPDQLPVLLFPRLYRPFWWRVRDAGVPKVFEGDWATNVPWGFTFYVGLVAFVLAVIAVVARRRRAGVWMLVCGVVAGWVLALGSATPALRFAYDCVPWFNTGRFPLRLVILSNCAIAVLAGMGVDAVVSASRDSRRRRPVGIALVLCAAMLFAGAITLVGARVYAGSWSNAFVMLFAHGDAAAVDAKLGRAAFVANIQMQLAIAAVLIVLLVAWAALSLGGRKPRFAATAAVVLVFAELTLYGFGESVATNQPRARSAAGEWLKLMPQPADGRALLCDSGIFARDAALVAGRELAGGYGPLSFRHVAPLLPAETDVPDVYQNALRDTWNVKTLIFSRNATTTDPLMQHYAGFVEMGSAPPAVRSVSCDVTTTTRATGVTLISSTGYTYTLPDDLQMGYVEMSGRDRSVTTAPIRLGEETAEWAYDSGEMPFKPAHRRPEVAVAVPNRNKRLFFVSKFDVPETMTLSRVALHVTAPPQLRLFLSHVLVQTPHGIEEHPLGNLTYQGSSPRHIAFSRSDNPGYAWMVGAAEPVSYGGRFVYLRKKFGEGFDVRRGVLADKRQFTSAALEQMNAPKSAEFAGTASFERTKPELVRIRTDANTRGWLVISQAYFSKWRATLDGQAAAIAQADGAICAVPVPAGKHTVELRLVWPEVWVGISASAVAWVSALGMLLIKRR